MDERRARIEDIFRMVVGVPDGADVAALTRGNEPRWDSLAQVSLVMALEQEFGVTFALADRAAMTSFPALVAAVARGLGEAG
jgi:acyl carrier protein